MLLPVMALDDQVLDTEADAPACDGSKYYLSFSRGPTVWGKGERGKKGFFLRRSVLKATLYVASCATSYLETNLEGWRWSFSLTN